MWLGVRGYVCLDQSARAQLSQMTTAPTAAEQAARTLEAIHNQIRTHEERERWNSDRAMVFRREAAAHVQNGRRAEAKELLRQAKNCDQTVKLARLRISKLTTAGTTVNEMQMNHQEANVMGDVVRSLEMLKTTNGVDVDKVEDVIGDLEENIEDVNQITAALSTPLNVTSASEHVDVNDEDDADLERELDELFTLSNSTTPAAVKSNVSTASSTIRITAPPPKHAPTYGVGNPQQPSQRVPNSYMVPASSLDMHRVDARPAREALSRRKPAYANSPYGSNGPVKNTGYTHQHQQPQPHQMHERVAYTS